MILGQKPKVCRQCGKLFVPEDPHRLLCSDECRRIRKRDYERCKRMERMKPKNTRKISKVSLEDRIREAKALGLSYGEMQMARTLAAIPRVEVRI